MVEEYDILIKNVKIVDGSGTPWFVGDIGIKDGRIEKVGKIQEKGEIEISGENLIAAPGFIDIHNHSDVSILVEPSSKNYISQGVTTVVVGNCGLSAAPLSDKTPETLSFLLGPYADKVEVTWKTFEEYLETLDKTDIAVNVATLVGHNTIRAAVMGIENRKPTQNELNEMKELVREAMEVGAFGMSTGLIYDPGVFSDTDEIIELAKVAVEYNGIYASHIRNESDLLVKATLEAIRVGKEANTRVEISHHKASGKRNWRLVKTTLALMEYYRRLGIEVTCDVYPYTFASTDLSAFFPPWTREHDLPSLVRDPAIRRRLKEELSRPSLEWENILFDAGFDGTIVAYSEVFKEYEGKSLLEISKELNMNPYDVMFMLIEKDPNLEVIAGGMSEEDVKYVISHRLSMIGSDGSVMEFGEGHPHPRSYGTFPRVIAKYVKEEKIITLEEAIKKMTYLPAWKLGLKDRGLIKEGFKADIVLFDFWNIKDTATFREPHNYADGMKYVIVNGKIVVDNGEFTNELPGEVLRRC